MGKRKAPPVIQGAQEHLSEADRWLIMGLAGKLGWSNERIVRVLNMGATDAIQRWAQRGRAGWETADDAERPGRPPKISGKAEERLRKAMCNQRFATPAKLAKLCSWG